MFLLRCTILLARMDMSSWTKRSCPKNFHFLCATSHPLMSRWTYPSWKHFKRFELIIFLKHLKRFELLISVDPSTHRLLSKLYAPASLAAMSPGVFIAQVLTILIPHWLQLGVQEGLDLTKTYSLPPPCCRPSCPAKCARGVGGPVACPPTTALRENKFHPYFNSPPPSLVVNHHP